MQTFTLFDADATLGTARGVELEGTPRAEGVAIDAGALERALGWRLEAPGLCRGDVCIPIRDPAALEAPGGVDLAGFASALGRPLALDVDERMAWLGTPAPDRGARLARCEAPDFTLPDLAGRPHTLSDHRGKKVLLIAYASW